MRQLGTFARITASGISLIVSVGCGDASPRSRPEPQAGVAYPITIQAATHAGLPTCTSALAGTIGYVPPPAAGSGLFECTGSNWIAVQCNTQNAGALAYGPSGTTGTPVLLNCSAGAWQNVTLPQGPQGPTGPQGAQGPTGSQGPQGSTGPQGPQGPTGPQGAMGATGATGAAGSSAQVGETTTGSVILTGDGKSDQFVNFGTQSLTVQSTGTCLITANAFVSGIPTTSLEELSVVVNIGGSGPQCVDSPPCSFNPFSNELGCVFPPPEGEASSCSDTASLAVTAGQTIQAGCLVTTSGVTGGVVDCAMSWVCTP